MSTNFNEVLEKLKNLSPKNMELISHYIDIIAQAEANATTKKEEK